jgi:hypothetical protein
LNLLPFKTPQRMTYPVRQVSFAWCFSEPGLDSCELVFEPAYRLLQIVASNDCRLGIAVETKSFAPALSPGDRLIFSLRANATIARPRGDKRAGRRDDVVMAVLNAIPKDERIIVDQFPPTTD